MLSLRLEHTFIVIFMFRRSRNILVPIMVESFRAHLVNVYKNVTFLPISSRTQQKDQTTVVPTTATALLSSPHGLTSDGRTHAPLPQHNPTNLRRGPPPPPPPRAGALKVLNWPGWSEPVQTAINLVHKLFISLVRNIGQLNCNWPETIVNLTQIAKILN